MGGIGPSIVPARPQRDTFCCLTDLWYEKFHLWDVNKFKIWKFFILSRLDSLLIENLGSEWSRNRISSLSIYIYAQGILLNGFSPPKLGMSDLIRIFKLQFWLKKIHYQFEKFFARHFGSQIFVFDAKIQSIIEGSCWPPLSKNWI